MAFHSHEYIEFEENHRFTDHDINGELKREDMTFVFNTTDRGTKVTATIDYELPYSVLGMIIGKLLRVGKTLDRFLKSGVKKAKETLET